MRGRVTLFLLVLLFSFSLLIVSLKNGIAQDSIIVGAVQTTIGPLGPFGREINAGLNDALTIAELEGGINGKKIKYIMANGNYNPKEDQVLFEQIFSGYKPLVMFGNSTELSKAMADEITMNYKCLYSGATFSSEVAYAAKYPSMFVPGPTYGDQMAILLKYIAKEKRGARIAFFYSDTEFGRDSIKFGKLMCGRLKLDLVSEQTASIKGGDITAQVEALNKAKPDYVVIHGFLVAPVPDLIKQCRDLGMKCTFIGTFWGATELLLDKLGPLAEGYLAVNPYSYWSRDEPMIRKIKEHTAKYHPDVKSRPIYYMQGFLTGLVFTETLRRADKAGELHYNGLVKALESLANFDTGGLTPPLTIKNNRFPVARVWKANPEKGKFEPLSDWITFYE
ncbi:MAG: ABC transporter substrate-binding protein [Desulfomonile tiedjei]|uniref:ABC transporter substrate-binding protein n=1 Tax=Desulfomonile tiedjei TaxID=2358 RepID=A0A9D6YZ56_9BACT|nr:ABC transporter substrate-binding protein [Desulfomonile tiedjei]